MITSGEPMSQQTARRGGAGWALVITSVAGFMAALDNLVVTTALPSIRKDLGGALEDLEWTVSAYTLTFAVLLMLGAALGDRFGRRRLFIIGLTVFTGASAAAGRVLRPRCPPRRPRHRARQYRTLRHRVRPGQCELRRLDRPVRPDRTARRPRSARRVRGVRAAGAAPHAADA